EARGRVHRARVGGDAVDVVRRETGVLDGGHARVEREVERVAEEPTADVGLPDSADDGALLDRVDGHQGTSSAGSNSGRETDSSPSSCRSKTTCTGMPILTSSGAQLTIDRKSVV